MHHIVVTISCLFCSRWLRQEDEERQQEKKQEETALPPSGRKK
jgi:hypothetical protein